LSVERIRDRYASVFLLVFAIVGYYYTLSMPARPAMFPRMILVGLGVLSIVLFINSLRAPAPSISPNGDHGAGEEKEKQAEAEGFDWAHWAVLIGIVLYTVLLTVLGFIVTTVVFCAVAMWLLGERRWPVVIGVSGLFTAAVYWLFFKYLYLAPLPGTLLERVFS